MKSTITTIGASLVLCSLASQVFASGFQIQEQNVTNLGTAYSGTAALAEDASTGFYNPAGLTRIPDGQVVLSGVLIQGDFNFSATSAIQPGTGLALGTGSADPGTVRGVPTFHLAKRLDDRWVFGFNITSPFGLATKYDEDSIARYLATSSSIETVNIEPSIAYQVVDCFSLAAGPDLTYTRATLDAQILTAVSPADGFVRNEADGFGYGWHVGGLWEPTENTRVGVNYRSKENLHVKGNTEALGPVSLLPPTQDTYISKVRSQVTLPDTATVSLYHEFGFETNLALTVDVAWTNWSKFKTLRLRYLRPINTPVPGTQVALLTPDTDTAENFRDARRYALGLTYTYDDCWLFRVGGAYDETPVRNESRTARLPDTDRYWLAIGGAYTFNHAWRIDFGYAHIFFKDATINERAPFIGQSAIPVSAATLTGNYDSSANLLGLQVRYDFI